MMVKVVSNEEFGASLHVSTCTQVKTGKEVIYCELTYHDKKTDKYFNKVHPATAYDKVCHLFYALSNRTIPADEIPGLFK